MRYFYSYFLMLSFIIGMASCQTKEVRDKTRQEADYSEEKGKLYDQKKAQRYGADQYGMKKYVMALLKEGPKRDQDAATAAQIQKAHLQNIGRLAEEGKLVLAGPFMDEGEIRGIYVFNVASLEEARELTNSDPAVNAGRLVMELKEWYGSAALMEVNQIHQTLEQKNVAE